MEAINEFAEWLYDLVTYVPRWVWDELLSALAGLVESIPVPDGFAQWAAVSGFPAELVWLMHLFQVKAGLSLVAGALLMRFLLRRIPLIG